MSNYSISKNKQKYANETTSINVDLYTDSNYDPIHHPERPRTPVPQYVQIQDQYSYDLISPSADEGIRKVKNMTLQITGDWKLTTAQTENSLFNDQSLYYVIRYINEFNSDIKEYIPQNYPRPLNNPSEIIMSCILLPNKPLTQTTRLARNLKKGDKISIIFFTSSPSSSTIYITKQNISLTFNYSIKF